LDDHVRNHYWSEIRRVTKPGGLIYSSVFAKDDKYYNSIGIKTAGYIDVVTDPNNGINKRLYSENEIKEILCKYFQILYFMKFQFSDIVLGRSFRRSLYVALTEKI